MWHRFGQGLREVIFRAVEQAEADGGAVLSPRHLLWGLAAEGGLPAAQLLAWMGVTTGQLHEALRQAAPREAASSGGEPTLTPEAREAMERAYRLAAELEDQYVGGEHLLLALAGEPRQSDAGRVLREFGVTWGQAGRALMAQQTWRTRPPQGVSIAGLNARRLRIRLRGKAGQIKRVAYGLAHFQKPFMPYLLLRDRTTDNPYPFYARLRGRPAYWDALMGHWIVTRYSDVVAALGETRLSQRVFSAAAWSHSDLPPLVQREFRCLQGGLDRQMLFQDAPDQPRQRALVARRFTPRVIAQMQAQILAIANRLLDGVEAAGQMEVVTDFAVPFPLLVITRMLGLPESDCARFKEWSTHYFKYLTFDTTLADDLAAYRSVREATDYFRALLPARRRQPQDDLITLLLQPDDGGEFLPDDDVIANCLLLLATGHENTTRLLSSGLLALLRHPDQWQQICDDPSRVEAAVEELLRYDSPVQWTLRHIQEDFEWLGHPLKKGQRVQVGIGPANHDPAQFPDPDRLDITRPVNRHVAFGYGPHFCLGAALTRLEAQAAFSCLIARFPRLRLTWPAAWRKEGLAFRGVQALPVRLD